MKILIMGLPGSGKTTLAQEMYDEFLAKNQSANWHNADSVRMIFDDWDFSEAGRTRQAERMGKYGNEDKNLGIFSICEFICPTEKLRNIFSEGGSPDYVIWMDTIKKGRYEDTNKMFEAPSKYDYRITSFNSKDWAKRIVSDIIDNVKPEQFDPRKPTVQMLGRWQPWHDGHQALFERALEKTGQVCIMIRDCQDWNNSNPFDVADVEGRIHKSLGPKFYGKYTVQVVPNIVNITYGRDVGYKIEQEVFDEVIHNISATKIRENLGLK
jgi:GTPase SAR1 family protein